MKLLKTYISLYFLSIIGFFFFSFTQVDLNLTLSRWSPEQVVEKFFQHIGYFQRPLATTLYIIFLTTAFISYLGFIRLARAKKLSQKLVWMLVLFTTAILVFSYNAFSYDIFNYIFDARIVTFYQQNPYIHKALDFPQDHMLLFMHWVQRTYPYGPVWLLITLPLSFLGFQIFLPTFFLFKLLAGSAFVGTVYFIQKTLKKISPALALEGIVLFGLNPLVIIESVISGHIDIVMAFFAAGAIYFLTTKKNFSAGGMLLVSIGVKFATGFLLPAFLYVWYKRKSVITWEKIILLSILGMIIAVLLETFRTNFQTWYLIPLLSVAALLPQKPYIVIPTILFSFIPMFTYVPFFYTGNWNEPIPTILFWIQITPVILSVLYLASYTMLTKKTRR